MFEGATKAKEHRKKWLFKPEISAAELIMSRMINNNCKPLLMYHCLFVQLGSKITDCILSIKEHKAHHWHEKTDRGKMDLIYDI